MARTLTQPPMGQSVVPDFPNWTWYEYGMRVGFWRLMRALKGAGVTATMSINAKVCETYPEVAAAAHAADWELMAHSYVPLQQIERARRGSFRLIAFRADFSADSGTRRPRRSASSRLIAARLAKHWPRNHRSRIALNSPSAARRPAGSAR
jgi:peptidoglycan/xylan/chitin deacetylase (PgdA/CDA1 family)